MRIVHTSDWHLGSKWGSTVSRLEDMKKHIIPEIMDIAVTRRADLLVIAGDLFDSFNRESVAECAALVREPFRRLFSEGVSIALIPGNHDQIEVFSLLQAVLGHDDTESRGQFIVFSDARVRRFRDIQIVGVPFLPDPYLDQVQRARGVTWSTNPFEGMSKKSGIYEQLITLLLDQAACNQLPAILIGHFAVRGDQPKNAEAAQVENYPGEERNYPDLFIRLGKLQRHTDYPRYNALGHVHELREVAVGPVPTYYSGAPDFIHRKDNPERKPQVLVVDIPSRGEVQVERLPITQATPVVNQVVKTEADIQALADAVGPDGCLRALGHVIIEVGHIADFGPLCNAAYDLFPRLKLARGVVPKTPQGTAYDLTETPEYDAISDPRPLMEEHFSRVYKDDPHLPLLRELFAELVASAK